MAVATSSHVQAATQGSESEPTLQYSSFNALPARVGSAYHVAEEVPVSGYYGQFTLHTEFGVLKVDGTSLLKQRIKEIKPTIELQKLSGSKVFADALANSAKSGAEAVGQAVVHPVDTLERVPSGIGRFFRSVGETAENVVSSSSSGHTGDAVADTLGINKAKRALAKKVGVDPYTTNPYLAKRLDDLAKAAVAGGVSIDVVLAVSTAGAAMIVSATKTVSNLAWNLPPQDIRELNDKHLAEFGVDQETRSRLLDNRWFTPTMELSFVEAMKAVGVRKGANEFTSLAAGAQSEIEARFYIEQLRLAHRYVKEGNTITRMVALGRMGAFRTEREGLFVPAPLDYLTWTQGVKAIVEGPRDPGVRARTVWFTGKASPTAAAELRRARWRARFNVAAGTS